MRANEILAGLRPKKERPFFFWDVKACRVSVRGPGRCREMVAINRIFARFVQIWAPYAGSVGWCKELPAGLVLLGWGIRCWV